MDLSWIAPAYAAANAGDFEPLARHLASTYTHRIPIRDVIWEGREEALAKLKLGYAMTHLTQVVTDVRGHGDYAIVALEVKSDLYPQGAKAVVVYRFLGSLVDELLGAYPAT